MRRSGQIGPRRVLLHLEAHEMAECRSRFHVSNAKTWFTTCANTSFTLLVVDDTIIECAHASHGALLKRES